jgi:serine/threonine-protein kinase PRP4
MAGRTVEPRSTAKRPRVDEPAVNANVDEDDEDAMLVMLQMMSDNKSNQDDNERALMQQREARRNARWKRAAKRDDEPTTTATTTSNSSPPARDQRQHSAIKGSSSPTKLKLKLPTTPTVPSPDDDFDMFSSSVSPLHPISTTSINTSINVAKAGMAGDFQDDEGYYKAVMGETLDLGGTAGQFTVLGVVGKGVFSTVLQCSTASSNLPPTVALKLIRHNDTMSKASQQEVRLLQKLQHPHIVRLLHTGDHRGHAVLVFDFVRYNLRDVLTKFGKGVGLSLTSVISYWQQLLLALKHLEQHSIIHADLKPDNILVTQDFTTCQLCDFGSAMEVGSALPTPYLVSRYYRAPEVILGMTPTPALDVWSIAVTIAELFLGNVLFAGRSNNDMLHQFMTKLGPVSNKTIRQHFVTMTKHPGIVPHFAVERHEYTFLQATCDKVTGHAVVQPLSLQRFPTKPLQSLLLKSKSPTDSRPLVLLFSELLHKSLTLEASRRIPVAQAMKHAVFAQAAAQVEKQLQQQQQQQSSTEP